jgi:nucleotide-binding universal stress UspA family protein
VILIGYDGSADAQAAIDHAGELLGAQPATVLAVWERFVSVLARSGAEAILEEADAVGAGAVVLGTRGLSGLKSLLLRSVSHAVLQHADRAVVVAPSAELAAKRASARS